MSPVRNAKPRLHLAIILFVAFVCMAVAGLDALHILSTRRARLAQAEIETTNLARSLAQHVGDVFESTDATIKGFRATLLNEGDGPAVVASLSRRMRTRVANQPVIQRVFVYDQNGKWVASSLDAQAFAGVRDLVYTDRDYFRYHRDHPEDAVLIGLPIETKLNGDRVITITRRIDHPDGSFAGVVGASVPLAVFQRFFETFDVGSEGAITLARPGGVILVRTPFNDRNVGRNVANSELFQSIRPTMETGSFQYVAMLDGVPRLGSFYRVPGFDLLMIVARGKDEVLGPWRRDTQIHFALTSVILVVIAVIGYQITVQTRRRAAAEERLVSYQRELERRVNERTADLQEMVSQRDLLLREVYHRVNNNMQAVDALLAMEERQIRDPEARRALAAMRTRVSTFGLAHQHLMAADDLASLDLGAFLQELVERLSEPPARNNLAVTVHTVSITVTLDFAVPLGMIVSELITACNSEASVNKDTRLAIMLERNASQDAVLDISLVPGWGGYGSNAAGRTRRLVEGLVRQIDGDLVVHEEDERYSWTITVHPDRPS